MIERAGGIGGGIDYYADPSVDPDDVMRFWFQGEQFPRVVIDPAGRLKLGVGSSPATDVAVAAGGAGGGGAPSYDMTEHGVYDDTDARYVSGAANTFAFNVFVATKAGEAAIFVLPPGTVPTTGFLIANSGHHVVGAGGRSRLSGVNKSGTNIRYVGTDPAGVAMTMAGTDGGGVGYGNRIYGCSMSGVYFSNAGPQTARALKLKHFTLGFFQDVATDGFRGDGGGVYAYNMADSFWLDCSWDFCGSADGTNKAVIKFGGVPDAGEAALWAVDACHFIKCRWENNSDRLFDFRPNAGLQVNKIFLINCKFENSVNNSNGLNGSNDANQAQFWFDTCQQIVFVNCDFTLQDKQAAFVLQTIFRLIGGCGVSIIGAGFHFGAGTRPKCFTNFIVANSASTVLAIHDMSIDSGNAGAFPTKVLAATNTPRLTHKGVYFTPGFGGSKVATDFYTAAEWQGVHAGAPSAGGVIS